MQLSIELRAETGVAEPRDSDYLHARTWPTPPELWVVGEHRGQRFEAAFVESGGRPILVGFTIQPVRRLEQAPAPPAAADLRRRKPRAEREEREIAEHVSAMHEFHKRCKQAGGFLFAEPLRGLTERELRRLPIATFLRQAQVAAGHFFAMKDRRRRGEPTGELDSEQMLADLRRVRAPRGRPDRSTDFYREIAEFYRAAVAQGKRPGAEIARRKRVNPNTARVWIHRARKLGFLEPVEEER
jgi:hypothetical protein